MLAVLGLHLVAAVCAPFLVKWIGRNTFYVLTIAPITAFVWALAHTSAAFNNPYTEELTWVSTLNLQIAFRVDVLSWLMILIVAGVGTLVMIYAARYFSRTSGHLGRFSGVFVAFAGAMLGVVTTDQTLMLYVFWELTSVLSFLLIGHHHHRGPARGAARQALLITGSGALAMFAGFIILGESWYGSYRISELVSALQQGLLPLDSPLINTAAVLIAVGAFTKSAQFPFYFWLPGAMAAPTPVSAYLHAAAMVKAGVYLVARLTPGFTLIPLWSPLIVTVGLVTMLVGAYRALRQYDLKLILAYGTVSQLGLMMAAVGFGDAAMMTAGLALMVAHSFFKSTLFLTVGAVEATTGTRDLRELSGLRHHRPLLATAAGLATLSMAGVPVTLGYLGKEGLVTALTEGTAATWQDGGIVPTDLVFLLVLVFGSMLTFAYSWRFWWGAFADKHLNVELRLGKTSPGMTIPIVILSTGALLGLAPHALTRVLTPPAQGLPGHPHLALWSGAVPALCTAVILAGGCLLAYLRPKVARLQRRISPQVSLLDVYTRSLRDLEIGANRVTGFLQRGSLTWDLTIIFLVLVGVSAFALFNLGVPTVALRLWDNVLQAGIVAVGICGVIVTVLARRRMKAVLGLSAVGMMVTLLFATQGAPDLALTQLVVEAVSLVVFFLVIRKLPMYFSDRPSTGTRWVRFAIAVAVGLIVIFGGWQAMAGRVHSPVSELMPAEALEFGYGENIVNVILVDIRAWDTVGELSVLLVTATGVASLIYVQSRSGKIDRTPEELRSEEYALPGVGTLPVKERSMVLEVATRALFPTMLLLSVWLLLIGHNNPGGGFAGGVVAGLAFVLRYLAGGRYELGEAMPIPPGRLLGTGLFVAAAGGAAPLLFGNSVLESTPVHLDLGWLGDIHFTTAMILDIGVYILVVGLVIDLVSALGAEIDRQSGRSLARAKSTAKKARRH